jgi:hypothetical protein
MTHRCDPRLPDAGPVTLSRTLRLVRAFADDGILDRVDAGGQVLSEFVGCPDCWALVTVCVANFAGKLVQDRESMLAELDLQLAAALDEVAREP